jgi:16S rRNA (guanine966-N2)-methyltransferase
MILLLRSPGPPLGPAAIIRLLAGAAPRAYEAPMRVIGGTARGMTLEAPRGLGTRPPLDRQRQALFDLLREDVDGAAVLDLCAGCGSLGIEALSRGAAEAVFVERDRAALEALRGNLARTGFAPRATVLAADWLDAAARVGERRFGLIFVDPPFRDVRERGPRLLAALAALAGGPLAPGGVLVLRVPAGAFGDRAPSVLEGADTRRYGTSQVHLYRR